MKLKDFLKEYNISIDELLENFYVINYNIDNEVQEKQRVKFGSFSKETELYVCKNTIDIELRKTQIFPPQFYE